MTEATAGLRMSARTPIAVRKNSGLMMMYASRPPEITTRRAK
jgi:hypothetical protein